MRVPSWYTQSQNAKGKNQNFEIDIDFNSQKITDAGAHEAQTCPGSRLCIKNQNFAVKFSLHRSVNHHIHRQRGEESLVSMMDTYDILKITLKL